MLGKVINFFRETKTEISKVSWPSRRELIDSTMAVIFATAMLAVFVGIIDFALSKALGALLLN